MHYVFIVLLCLFTLSCREIQPVPESRSITGYQLNGVVTTNDGFPLEGVTVSLYYYYDYVGSTPIDTQQVIITDTMKIIDVSVYTRQHEFIRTLFFGRVSNLGPLRRYTWNGMDSKNNSVPSNIYLIGYYVDTAVVKYSPYLIEGHTTAITGVGGNFTITNNNLPIGEQFDIYNFYGSFDGAYKIMPKIALVFQKYDHSSTYDSIELVKGEITNRAFTL